MATTKSSCASPPKASSRIIHIRDGQIEAEEMVKMRHRLNEVIANQTGQPLEKVEKDTRRNFWMSAVEAKEYGLVGSIVESIDDVD